MVEVPQKQIEHKKPRKRARVIDDYEPREASNETDETRPSSPAGVQSGEVSRLLSKK